MIKAPVQEKALFRLIAAGDEQAFAELFGWSYDKIYSVALMYLKIHEAAEDITQQVFLKLWEKRASLAAVEEPSSYLFTIARNEILNLFRRKTTQEHYRQFVLELFRQEEHTPEQQLIIKQKALLMEDIVRQLPLRQQEAFRLSREKGLSYEQIAVQMGVSVPTVKEHISKALAHIRTLLMANRNEFLVAMMALICGRQ